LPEDPPSHAHIINVPTDVVWSPMSTGIFLAPICVGNQQESAIQASTDSGVALVWECAPCIGTEADVDLALMHQVTVPDSRVGIEVQPYMVPPVRADPSVLG
jgi:hypothetical protein